MNQSPESGRSNHENSLGWGVSLLISVSCVAIWVVCFLLVMNLSDEQVNAALPGVSRNWLVIATSIPLFALALVFLGLAIYRYFRRPAGIQGNTPVDTTAHASTSPSLVSQHRFPRYTEVSDLNFGLLRTMEWRRFEIVCAEYLRSMGYEVLETGFGNRFGVDLEVFLPGKAQLFNIVRCIASDRKAPESSVREFVEIMRKRQVNEGMIFSVRGFEPRAARFAARHRIALVDGETLCQRVRGLGLEARQAMVQVAVNGDYTTPTCPNCGVRLVLRRHKRRLGLAGEFWGCINHPSCKVTMSFA